MEAGPDDQSRPSSGQSQPCITTFYSHIVHTTVVVAPTLPVHPNKPAMDQSSSATRVATPVQKELPKTSGMAPDSPLTVMHHEDNALTNASTARKLALMVLFSAAQFLDAFNNWCVHTIV